MLIGKFDYQDGPAAVLNEGQRYTRQQIHDLLGGDTQIYLPHKGGRVLCGCFVRDERQPDAPEIVTLGHGREVYHWAEVFCDQVEPVPVFLKRAPREWEFVGYYVVERWTEDPDELEAHRHGRNEIARVMFLKRVG